jgi:hypothetical protein
MSIKPISIFSPEWFKPSVEKDAEPPTRFMLQGLTGSQQAQLAPEIATAVSGDLVLPGAAINLLLRYGLVNWENFDDESGPVVFSENPVKNQDRIPYAIQAELAARIFTLSFAPPDVKKK